MSTKVNLNETFAIPEEAQFLAGFDQAKVNPRKAVKTSGVIKNDSKNTMSRMSKGF